MEKLTAKEKRITKAIAKITTVFVTLLAGINIFISFDSPKQWLIDQSIQPYQIAVASTIIAIVFIYFADEQIFGKFIFLFPDFRKNRKIIGDWQIEIKFDENGIEKIRHGQLTVTDSIAGIKIKGKKLFDSSHSNVTMERWEADDVEFIENLSGDVIIYLYKTGNTSSEDEASGGKVGLVVAQKTNSSSVYTGVFEDISIEGGAQKREGKVSLYKSE